jgi:hypothetical protein
MKLSMVVFLAVLPGVLWAQAAVKPAAAPKKVLVLPVDADALSAEQKAAYDSALRAALKPYPDLAVLPPLPGDLTEAMMELGCMALDADCVQNLAMGDAADLVLYSTLGEDGKTLVTRLFGPDGAEVKNASLALGGPGDAAARSRDALFVLLGAPPAAKPELATLEVSSTVPGTTVLVNEQQLGSVPLSRKFPAGTYKVRGRHEGYTETVVTVTLKAGETSRVSLALAADAKPVAAVAESAPDRTVVPPLVARSTPVYETWWFWTAVGAGVAAIVVPSVYFLTQPSSGPSGSLDLVIHPVTFQDDVLLRR